MSSAIIFRPALKHHLDHQKESYHLAEAVSLAETLGLEVLYSDIALMQDPKPGTLLGKGKVEACKYMIDDRKPDVVIIDTTLTPIQQRNLEKAWQCKVIDRTGLILDIFAMRARTKEGKLQVELAALEYQRSRLVRSWTHLERQRGGLGFIGGPGEKQIETDKRLLSEHIARIKKQIEKVKKTRQLHRKSRQAIPYPIIALVGYTNAGKSTLFNYLTGEKVLAEDKLFATLDPTMRMVTLPSGKKVILSDTVGFISELPTELVMAFHATLEEVMEADLLLHVRDIALEASGQQKRDVEKVLGQLGLEDALEEHMIEVWNKVDLLEDEIASSPPRKIGVSAIEGRGIMLLLDAIDQLLAEGEHECKLRLSVSDGRNLAWIYEHASILERQDEDMEIMLHVRISEKHLHQMRDKGLDILNIE